MRRLAVAVAVLAGLAACRGPAPAPATARAERGQAASGAPQGDSTAPLRDRNPAARRLAAERYQMLKHIQSRLHGYYLGQGFGYYNAVLFPLATSERVYVLELPRRVSCYQRADRGVKLVCQVSLKERDRVVTKRRPARTAMPEGRIESLLDYLYVTEVLSEWVAWEGSKEHAISYSLRGSRFAMRDLAARREYVKYDYEPVVSTLYVSLLLADHSKGGRSAGDAYFVEDDPDTITRNKNGYSTDVNAFYRNDGLPAAKAELKLLR